VVALAAGLAAGIVTDARRHLRRLVAASGTTIPLRDV
jgi:hypothetical protein